MASSRQAVVVDLGEYRRRKQGTSTAGYAWSPQAMTPLVWCWVWMTFPYGYLAASR